MEPRFDDLREKTKHNKDLAAVMCVGGTTKADLWLLIDSPESRTVLVCQYEDNDTYVSYSPPYAAVLDALGEYDHTGADKWIGFGLRGLPPELCMRWGNPSHEDHNIEEIARYVAVFLPDHVPPELRARILEGENHE